MKQLYKFAGAVLDYYDDPAFVDSVHAKAHFGKTLVAPEKVSELPDSSFAVKIASKTGYQRRFPIYNAIATKASCHYFDMAYDELPEEIQKSAGYFLGKACDKFEQTKTASIQKNAEEAPFTVEYVTTRPKEVRLSGEHLTKMAEARLAYELPKMALVNRTRAATALYKEAGDNLIRQDVWDYVEKPVVGPMLEGALDDRAEIMKTASRENQYLFDSVRDQLDDMTPTETIDALLAFDKYAELDDRYRHGLIDPYIAVYGGWTTPVTRERNLELQLEKAASPVDAYSGQRVGADTAKGLSVEQHLYNLRTQYPKGTEGFNKAASADLSESMLQKWGDNYVKARKIYFGA